MAKADVIEKAKNAGWITTENFDEQIEDLINTVYGDIVNAALVEKVKLAARITTDAFDSQISDLLVAAFEDMRLAGVVIPDDEEGPGPLIVQAAITYVLMRFGEPDQYGRLKRSYDEQKSQLVTNAGTTKWTEAQS